MKRVRSEDWKRKQRAYGRRPDVVARRKQRWASMSAEQRTAALARMRVRGLKAAYKLTAVGFLALVHFQNGQCAICRVSLVESGTWVDHDHATGKVRGALCPRCNTYAGGDATHITFLQKVTVYIKETSVEKTVS